MNNGSDHLGLLNLAVPNVKEEEEEDTYGRGDIIDWFENASASEAQAASIETTSAGETALHIILKNSTPHNQQQQLLDVVKKFIEIDSDAFRIQDNRGYLPLHYACIERRCSFEVIQELIEAYPQGLGVSTRKTRGVLTHTPFGWDYNISIGGHFTDFLKYATDSDTCDSGRRSALTKSKQMRKDRHRLLNHCKNYVPLDILKAGMLNERILESKAMIRWLNEMPCKRTIVFSMVFELYLHIAWIVTFIHTTRLHIEDDRQPQGWEPIALLVFAGLFFFQEIYQLYRYIITNAGIEYWLDLWNWVDLTTSSLVAASAIKFLQKDESVRNDHLLITTG